MGALCRAGVAWKEREKERERGWDQLRAHSCSSAVLPPPPSAVEIKRRAATGWEEGKAEESYALTGSLLWAPALALSGQDPHPHRTPSDHPLLTKQPATAPCGRSALKRPSARAFRAPRPPRGTTRCTSLGKSPPIHSLWPRSFQYPLSRLLNRTVWPGHVTASDL